MQNGVVKWFHEQKGYGFIESESKSYFAHFSQIQKNGFKVLRKGDTVSFNPANGEKGLCAHNILAADGADWE